MPQLLDILITTSLGLCKDASGNYFAQIISHENEDERRDRNDLFFPIPALEARRLSKLLRVEISKEEETISCYNADVVLPLRG